MLRFFQILLLAIIGEVGDCLSEPISEDRWGTHSLNRSLGPFDDQWDKLNQQIMNGHPMLDSRFVDGLLRHFGDGSEHLCLLSKDDQALGMCILKPGKAGVWSTFLPPQAQVAPVLIREASSLEALLAKLPVHAWQMDLLCQDPNFSPPFADWPKPHKRMQHALTINIPLEGGFEAYWAGRPKELRKTMRTRDNRLAKADITPAVVLLDKPEDMGCAVERFGKLETAGWKGRAGTAVSADNIQGTFYREVLEHFAETGQAMVYEYWLNDRHAASQLALTSQGMVLLLKTSYDEEFANFSPGRQLLRLVIQDGFQRFPGRVMEFYTNANSDQLAWAVNQRWIEHVSLYRNRTVEQLLSAAQTTWNALKPAHAFARHLQAKYRGILQPESNSA